MRPPCRREDNTQNNLETHQKPLEGLIDGEQAAFSSGSFSIDYINPLRVILGQYAGHKSSLHLLFIDFDKAFDSMIRECI